MLSSLPSQSKRLSCCHSSMLCKLCLLHPATPVSRKSIVVIARLATFKWLRPGITLVVLLQFDGSSAIGDAVDTGRTKVIVFSQFWIHINLVRTHLLTRNIRHTVLRAGIPASEKIEALETFQVSPPYDVYPNLRDSQPMLA